MDQILHYYLLSRFCKCFTDLTGSSFKFDLSRWPGFSLKYFTTQVYHYVLEPSKHVIVELLVFVLASAALFSVTLLQMLAAVLVEPPGPS